MNEIIIRRLTYCPTGNAKDVRSFEIVMVLNDDKIITDKTARTVQVDRVYSRGDLGVLEKHGLKSIEFKVNDVSLLNISGDHAESLPLGLSVDVWKKNSLRKMAKGIEEKSMFAMNFDAKFVNEKEKVIVDRV